MTRQFRRRRVAPAVLFALLAITGTASPAVVGLPSDGTQVNNDPAVGIDPNQDAGVSDVVGGSLGPGAPHVPVGAFAQKPGASQQIFVRAFKGGRWVTQGQSLNIQANQEAEAPSIDFAGFGRTVPWTAWYEPNSNLAAGAATNIFASRFNAAANVWVPEGQDRAPVHAIPSLNIHTDRTAENPALVGGAAVAGNDPVPWVAWQEKDGAATDAAARNQLFASRAIKQTSCAANQPGGGTSVSQFCWRQTGVKRLSAAAPTPAAEDPSLNVDPTRDGIEPDFAFTGNRDTVPWVAWYEQGASGIGLRGNEQVFAGKAVPDAAADGGFRWVAVGRGTAGQVNPLDASGAAHGFGP